MTRSTACGCVGTTVVGIETAKEEPKNGMNPSVPSHPLSTSIHTYLPALYVPPHLAMPPPKNNGGRWCVQVLLEREAWHLESNGRYVPR